MEPFFDLVTDHRPPLRSSKHQMNKTTNVTVRHKFSRPFGTTHLPFADPKFRPFATERKWATRDPNGIEENE
jgi:hypothetical protein